MSTPDMSQVQKEVLRDDIAADPVLSLVTKDMTGAQQLAAAYNADATPSFAVYKTALSKKAIVEDTSPDGTTWSWPIFIARSQGERDAWREMFSITGEINPSRPNVQLGMQDIFSGQPGAAQRQHLAAMARRLASRFERLYATGTGTAASPGLLVLEGPCTPQDIMEAWGA